MTTKDKLIHAVTQYDIKQSKKKHHNPYALAQYLSRIDEICADIEAGADVRKALAAGFTGSLLDACLKALALNSATKDEYMGGSAWAYTPIKL